MHNRLIQTCFPQPSELYTLFKMFQYIIERLKGWIVGIPTRVFRVN
jgi:hypothetical protein